MKTANGTDAQQIRKGPKTLPWEERAKEREKMLKMSVPEIRITVIIREQLLQNG